MPASTTTDFTGERGRLTLRQWDRDDPTFVVVLAHGLGEHSGRYEHVAGRLVADGGVVYAPDHWGHGLSEGEAGLVDDVESVVSDFANVVERARSAHPGLPVVVIGHSLGGIIATRYVQRNPDVPAALVLSGPVIGGNDLLIGLLQMEEIPDIPIDPAVLSRDPEVGARYAADPLVYSGPLLRGTLEGVAAAVATIAEGGSLGDLPTLWIHGEMDALAPLPETAAAFEIVGGSALTSKVYPGAMHEIFNETNSDEVLDDTSRFILQTIG